MGDQNKSFMQGWCCTCVILNTSTGPYRSRTCKTERRSAKVTGVGETSTRMDRSDRDRLARLAAEDMAINNSLGEGRGWRNGGT